MVRTAAWQEEPVPVVSSSDRSGELAKPDPAMREESLE